MSTGAGFSPATDTPCPGPMTRAELISLRNGGLLRIACHYVVTDGPAIGTTGNTSPTSIEMHAVSATELSTSVMVNTQFGAADTWPGIYDIDTGASGSIVQLTDRWNNTVKDSDSGAPTVHTQFPWHLSGNNQRDNVIEDCTLLGLTAGATFNDNALIESTVNLTGRTTGNFNDNIMTDTVFTAAAPTQTVIHNNMIGASVASAGTGALVFTDNTFLTGQFVSNAASTAALSFISNVVGGAFIVRMVGKTVGAVNLTGNRLFNRSQSPEDIYAAGTGSFTVTNNVMNNVHMVHDGSVPTTVADSQLNRTIINQTPSVTAPLSFNRCTMGAVTINIGSTNVANNLFQDCNLTQGTIDLQGPTGSGQNQFNNVQGQLVDWAVAANATAGLRIIGGYYAGGTVRQNRTVGGAAMVLDTCDLRGASSVTDNGGTDPTSDYYVQRVKVTDSTLTVGSIGAKSSGTSLVVAGDIDMTGSTLTITGVPGVNGVVNGRMLKSTLVNATFNCNGFAMDFATKTLTAANVNVSAQPGYDNFV